MKSTLLLTFVVTSANIVIGQVCVDDLTWTDHKYGGDGTGDCAEMRLHPDWCTEYGDYSLEAQRACPVACGVCKG